MWYRNMKGASRKPMFSTMSVMRIFRLPATELMFRVSSSVYPLADVSRTMPCVASVRRSLSHRASAVT